jgi:hypothetical protein
MCKEDKGSAVVSLIRWKEAKEKASIFLKEYSGDDPDFDMKMAAVVAFTEAELKEVLETGGLIIFLATPELAGVQ